MDDAAMRRHYAVARAALERIVDGQVYCTSCGMWVPDSIAGMDACDDRAKPCNFRSLSPHEIATEALAVIKLLEK